MNNNVVQCVHCLEYINVDNAWCNIEKHRRFYECKNTNRCYILKKEKFPPSPPEPPEPPLQPQPPEPQPPTRLKDIKKGIYSVIKSIDSILFPKYNSYERLKLE